MTKTQAALHKLHKVRAKNGAVHLWLQGKTIEACGFIVGASYTAQASADGKAFTMALHALGERRVSKKKQGAALQAVIDTNSKALASVVGADASQVAVSYQYGLITVTRAV